MKRRGCGPIESNSSAGRRSTSRTAPAPPSRARDAAHGRPQSQAGHRRRRHPRLRLAERRGRLWRRPDWTHGLWKGRSWVEGAVYDYNDAAVSGRSPWSVIDHVGHAMCDGAEGWGLSNTPASAATTPPASPTSPPSRLGDKRTGSSVRPLLRLERWRLGSPASSIVENVLRARRRRLGLRAGRGGRRAEVLGDAERQVGVGVAPDVEAIGVGEDIFVAIRGRVDHRHLSPFGIFTPRDFSVGGVVRRK